MIFHPKTDRLLQSYIKNPAEPLLIQTNSLTDATAFVNYLASKFLNKNDRQDINSIGIDDEETYSIDRVREFKNSLKLLPNSPSTIARIAVIYNADRFSEESQNTLLKFLEEPPKKTLVILHFNDKQMILDTIQSRCVFIPLLPITVEQATLIAEDLGIADEAQIKRIYTLSTGQSEKFASMLVDSENVGNIEEVKKFLSATTFERLSNYVQYDSKEKLLELCQMLELISAASMHTTQASSILRWKSIAIASRTTKLNIKSNASTKLAYLQLCVNI